MSAYQGRDSVETDSVYADDYVGTSTDLSLPTPLPPFSKADEVRHVGRLKRDPNIVSVMLDLGLPSSWQRLPGHPSDPTGWATIQITNFSVHVEDITTATTWHAVNNVLEYTFKPTVSSPGDTTWTVVRWSEFAN